MKFPLRLFEDFTSLSELRCWLVDKYHFDLFENGEFSSFVIAGELLDILKRGNHISMNLIEGLSKVVPLSDVAFSLTKDYADENNVDLIVKLLGEFGLDCDDYYECVISSKDTFFFSYLLRPDIFYRRFVIENIDSPNFILDIYFKFVEFSKRERFLRFRDLFKGWHFFLFSIVEIKKQEKEILKLNRHQLLDFLENVMNFDIPSFYDDDVGCNGINHIGLVMYFLNGGDLEKISKVPKIVKLERTHRHLEIKTSDDALDTKIEFLLSVLENNLTRVFFLEEKECISKISGKYLHFIGKCILFSR